MTYVGRVQNGVVVFDGNNRPPDGTLVRVVEIVGPTDSDNKPQASTTQATSIWEALREFDGVLRKPPTDQ